MDKKIWELTSIKEAATRPEFYQFMNVGMKDLLFGAYKNTPSTYEEIVTVQDSDKNKEGYPSLGMVGEPKQVLEGEPYPERPTPDDDYVEVTNYKFGEIIAITEEMIDDDQTKQIIKIPTDLGAAHKKFEDKSVYNIINTNPTIYDGSAFFALNHPGLTGGAAIAANDNIYTSVTLTAGALATAIGMIGQWCGHTSDDILDVAARQIVVPKTLFFTAQVLTSTPNLGLGYAANVLGPAAATTHAPNPFMKLGLGITTSPRLDGTSTGDWYIRTDFPGFIFQWRKRLALLAENDRSGVRFERDVLRWKSTCRFRVKIINWRCMMKVS